MKVIISWIMIILCFIPTVSVCAENGGWKIEIFAGLPDHGNLRSSFVEFTDNSSSDFERGTTKIRGNGDGTYWVTVDINPVGERRLASEDEVMANVTICGNPPEKTEILENGGARVTGYCYAISGRRADQLYRLGLAKGIGHDADGRPVFDIAAVATRAEAVVMLVRLMGKEEEALNCSYTHPFTDVPVWADGYVSLAYESGLVKGISEKLFDANAPVSREMFLTFLLRALNYSEGENNDFVWDNPYALAKATGIWQESFADEKFLRKEMFNSSFCTLFAYCKNGNQMYKTLISDGVFSDEKWEEAIYEPENYDGKYIELRSRITSGMASFENAYFNERGPFYVTVLNGKTYDSEIYSNRLYLIYNTNYHSAQYTEEYSLLPLPQSSDNDVEITDCRFSNDYTKFLYTCTYTENVTDSENSVNSGRSYFYTTDLRTGKTNMEILPLN